MFLGMLLIGPVVLKMASTGYRFVRYYAANPRYRSKGPPPAAMRLIAPIVVLSTVVVFASGVALLFAGPGSRGTLTPLHKVSFFVWIAFTGLHVLGHLAELPAALRADGESRGSWDDHGSGRGARALSLAGAIVGGPRAGAARRVAVRGLGAFPPSPALTARQFATTAKKSRL